MNKETRDQPEYLIESDYLIFHRITRFVYQTWIAFSVLVVVLGSYDYTDAGIISTLLLKFSGLVSHAIPLIDQLAKVRPQPDATRVIQCFIIFLVPFEMVRLVRMMRQAADGAKNKTLLMKKLCGNKKTLAGCFLFSAYAILFISFLLTLLVIFQICDCRASNHNNFWDHFYDIMISSTLGVELVVVFVGSWLIYTASVSFVAVSFLLREKFNSQKGK